MKAPGTVDASRLASIAQELYTDGPFLLRKMQHLRPYICPFERLVVHVPDGADVLDIGCGAGVLMSLIAGLGIEFKGLGFDVSTRAIALARAMADRVAASSLKARLAFETIGIGSTWPSGTFDVVFLVDVLHHVSPETQREFLERVISKVASGGVLVFKDMCSRPWWKAAANRLHDLLVAREWIHYVPIEMVEEWAESSGMEVFVREDLDRFWYGHELRVMRR